MSNLRTRTKNRKIKRRILKILNLFKFKTNNLDIFLKLIIIWLILSIISLFLPWIDITSWEEKFNAFSYLTWMVWYFLFFLDIFLIFIVISNKRKEDFKINMRLFFRDNSLIIFSWIIIFVFSLNSFFVIKWLTFYKEYLPWKWLILSFVSSIIIMFSWIMEYNKNKKENYSLYTNNSKDIWTNLENDRNMKLPFDY
jgi:hypothetical protein